MLLKERFMENSISFENLCCSYHKRHLNQCYILGFQSNITGPAPSKRGNLGPVPAPVARGCHGPLNNATCPIRGLQDPVTMTMEQGGGVTRRSSDLRSHYSKRTVV